MSNNSDASSQILQSLNIVQPTTPPNPAAAQDLLSAPAYADIAQLDLWTNVAFASDEPFAPPDNNSDDGDEKEGKEPGAASTLITKRKRNLLAGRKSYEHLHHLHHAHDGQQSLQRPAAILPVDPNYDIHGLLALAGNQFAPDINQLLALGSYPGTFQAGFPFPAFPTGTAPTPSASTSQSAHPPPAKKSRSTKDNAPIEPAPAPTPIRPAEPRGSASPASSRHLSPLHSSEERSRHSPPGESSRPLTTAEDKRRRNTQASARFRLKKKEREQAMESKCRELESKVGELERECEALRRENGWLKGLVVGVTGGTGMPMTIPSGPALPTISTAGQSSSGSSSSSGSKRKRDTATEAS
ncbi:hypothetical protein FRB99_001446 [Tulasnella sp. 403]|nr:hypothetical protein FRB99_001446 [Tulasnella sp. 403]